MYVIPQREGVSMRTANLPAMKGKIYQLNDDLGREIVRLFSPILLNVLVLMLTHYVTT